MSIGQWYHSHADPIWPDGTFKILGSVLKLQPISLKLRILQLLWLSFSFVPTYGDHKDYVFPSTVIFYEAFIQCASVEFYSAHTGIFIVYSSRRDYKFYSLL
jgi:hypothetical protein